MEGVKRYFKTYINTYNSFLTYSFVCVFVILIIKVTCFDFIPAPLPFMYELSNITEGFLSGYLISVIFHFIVNHISKIKDKENVKIIIEAHISKILKTYLKFCFIVRYHFNIYKYNMTPEENETNQSKKKSIEECLLNNEEIESITKCEFIYENRKEFEYYEPFFEKVETINPLEINEFLVGMSSTMKGYLKNLMVFNTHIETDIIERLYKIVHSKFNNSIREFEKYKKLEKELRANNAKNENGMDLTYAHIINSYRFPKDFYIELLKEMNDDIRNFIVLFKKYGYNFFKPE